MAGPVSFDIILLGLTDASASGRRRFLNAMSRLTGRDEDEFQSHLSQPTEPLFNALDQTKARQVAGTLGEAGVRIEIRPNFAPAIGADDQTVVTQDCPGCNFANQAEAGECQRCGLVFAKWERESIQRMQREQRLEEALSQALQVREEWTTRAKAYLENHPLPEQAAAPFAGTLLPDEIPFQGLTSDEGPMIMTSRRLVGLRDDVFVSIPYELVNDVDVGGGLVQRKGRIRLQLSFYCPLPMPDGSSEKNLAWHLDKESSFHKDLVMDWAFARNFICGSCGSHDLDYRLQDAKAHARCMHCATDHEIDVIETVAIPDIRE